MQGQCSSRPKQKYRVTVNSQSDDGFGNKSSHCEVMETWAISEKQAISNVRFRVTKALKDSLYAPVVYNSYEAEIA